MSDELESPDTCWDADRLDLPRLGIATDPARLCTGQAMQPAFYRWAIDFSAHNAAAVLRRLEGGQRSSSTAPSPPTR